MTRSLIIGIMALFIGNYGMAQEQLSRKEQADVLFNRYDYFPASKLYLPLAERKTPELKVLEKLAACYRMMNDYDAAERWYSKVVADPKANPLSHYYYAEALQRNEKFNLAKAEYAKYGELSGNPNEVTMKIASCDSAALWIKMPKDIKVKNMESLNTKSADWGLTAYGNEGYVFASERPLARETKGNDVYKWNGNPWLKVFTATADGQQVKGELQIVTERNMPAKAEYHVGPVVFNSTADLAFVTIATRAPAAIIPLDKTKGGDRLYTRRLELLIAVKNGDKWELKSFPYNDVKAYSLGHAALSKDEKVIYFASDMPGGYGKSDIWFSEQQADGSWAKPVNCGAEVNTKEEDAFPTIGPDGELFFASKGKIGMGGYDIYRSTGSKTQWSKSENLKYPLNSTSDDFYLYTKDGKFGYLSSNRQGGAGDDDIYSFSEKPQVMVLALSGTVFERQTKARLSDVLVVLVDGTGKQVNTKVTEQNGDFFFNLNKDQDYKVAFSKLGYTDDLKVVSTKGLTKSDTLSMQAFLDKDKFEPGKTYVLKNIYYDFDKSNIRPDAAKELNKLLAILKENPAIAIELGSHTDSRGPDQYNQWLSQKRANAAVQYLIDRGIDKSRIIAKGYGETMLLNKCGNGVKCSHAEHQLNRRTEFKVIKK